MIDSRKKAFNSISRVLAITRYDIEQRQTINEYGLNIHGENYFRDVFNFVYGYNFINGNFESQNSACVDLVDKNRNLAYQITTTRTKEKKEKIDEFIVKNLFEFELLEKQHYSFEDIYV